MKSTLKVGDEAKNVVIKVADSLKCVKSLSEGKLVRNKSCEKQNFVSTGACMHDARTHAHTCTILCFSACAHYLIRYCSHQSR